MRLLRSSAVVGGFTLLSRFFGVTRDILLAARLGAGPLTDAFFTALTFPNLFRRIFAEGAFNSAFIPLYARRLEGEGQEEADRFASEVLSVLTVSVLALVVLSQILMPWLMYPLGPGFVGDPGLFAFAVLMTQITMPYLLCMSLAAMISGALNSHARFATAAAAPILLNVVLITVLLFAPGERRDLALWLSIGVTASGVLQAGWLYLTARQHGIRLTVRAPRLTSGVKRLVVLGVPGAAAAGVTHFNQLVSGSIATLQEGARSWIYYAERLYQLPLGVIGIAMGVALLPALSKRLRAGDDAGAMGGQNRAIEISMALTLPAAAALLVIPDAVVAGLFQRGAFDSSDTQRTALALAIYAAGLPAFVLIKVFAPGFFAREDTLTPMKFAGASMAMNLLIGVALFFGPLGYAGLALGTTLAGWLNAILLGVTLMRRGQFVADPRLKHRLARIVLACLVMMAALWLTLRFGEAPITGLLAAHLGAALTALVWMGILVLSGFAVFVVTTLAIGGLRPQELLGALKRDSAAVTDKAPSGTDA
ncbi:murein biosynthesis integral membrane protein MurJ [Oceanicaulis sp.]|uniref:murein biosynthesis integral membrane protein MurJ n=1 Tax=Oceanicaulis sp. TaxID=1924941 RepID=UPI003BA9DD68